MVEALRHTVSGVNMPDGLTLDDLLRLGEEIVPAPDSSSTAAAEAGAKLEGLNPMQLVAFLASKVLLPAVHASTCQQWRRTELGKAIWTIRPRLTHRVN